MFVNIDIVVAMPEYRAHFEIIPGQAVLNVVTCACSYVQQSMVIHGKSVNVYI